MKSIALPSHITFKDVYTFYDVAAISSRAIQCLQFHLGEVLGMARWYNRFGVLGLSEAAVQGTGYDCLDNKRDLFKNSVSFLYRLHQPPGDICA